MKKITIIKIISITFILIGTLLTVNKKTTNEKDNKWILYSVLTAIFTSTTTIISKIGLNDIDSVLATFIRTFIVFIILIFTVIFKKRNMFI
ncbi:MAG: EamA family transporter [Clostridium sp.]|nr:MAG: EamA family transporter [Clostridium sp.]